MGQAENTSAKMLKDSSGRGGSVLIDTSGAITPPTSDYVIRYIDVIEDINITAFTNEQTYHADLTEFTLIPAGTVLYGDFTSVTISTGSAIGYITTKA